MCDVVFLTPNMSGKLGDASIGTLQLATILNEKGVSCQILPYFSFGDITDFSAFVDNVMNTIEEHSPKVVSFYTRCDVYHIVLRLAQRIKARWENMYVIFGGPQSDITSEETIRQIPYVDYICCGEGEQTIYPFISSLLRGTPDLSVAGLVYRDGDQVIKNPRPKMLENLDDMPFLDYSLLKTKTGLNEKKTFGIDVGRGCPFSCVFCSTKTFWGRKYRLKSPQRICEEMQDLHSKYGATSFKFTHDMFTLNRDKVEETCRRMNELDFKVKWGCSARLDCIDPELIDVMADSGMYGIYMGIETGSPRMQKLINKRLNLDRAVEIAAYLKSKNIQCVTSFIYGFPEETEEDVSQTMALMAKLLNLKTVMVQAHLCAFLVGTELTETYKDALTPAQVYSDQTGTIAIAECQDLIQAHPALFSQMMEYKTELRTKLEFFPQFWQIWQIMQPVYQYISEFYPENRLIDMYYDFVDSNRELLERLRDMPDDLWGDELIREDRFYERFAQDGNYDIIADLYRMKRVAMSEEVRNGGSNTDMYCIAPNCEKKYDSLRDYPRCLAMVTYSKNKCDFKVYSLDQLS